MTTIPLRRTTLLLALCAFFAAAGSARGAVGWHDGAAISSTLYNPCLQITEGGAVAQTGYQTDPETTRPGDVFYGHAVFGAATHVGGNCTDTDQAAELDLVLPPGVTLAVDAKHPIKCLYEDENQPGQLNPTCPTHATTGMYGPQLPAGDGGGAWDMPVGRTLEVDFPLVSDRELKGPAGGHCPDDLTELAISSRRDCLLLALHVADGSDDPVMLPRVEMVVAAGDASFKAPRTIKLSALRAKGLAATLSVPQAGGSAKLTLKQGSRTLGTVTKSHLAAGKVSVRVRLSKAGKARVRRGKLTLVEKLSRPATTLHATVLAR